MKTATEADATEVTFEIVPADLSLPPEEKQSLIQSFSPMLSKARELLEESRSITSAKLARVSRLQFRKLRGDSEALRKSLKEHHLRMGKAIDGAHNILVAAVQAEEKRMEDIEKEEERREEARIEGIRQCRHDLLVPLGVHESIYNSPGLGRMAEDAFTSLLADSRAMHEARLERERKAEEERLAAQVAEAQERERIRLDNERLLKEAAEREEAARIERQRAEVERRALEAKLADERAEADRKAQEAFQKARAEREKQEAEAKQRLAEAQAKALKEKQEAEATARAEREVLEKKAAEERAAREKLEAQQRAAVEAENARRAEEERKQREADEAKERSLLAPDKEKFLVLVTTLKAIQLPTVKSKAAKSALVQFGVKINNLADWIEEKAGEL